MTSDVKEIEKEIFPEATSSSDDHTGLKKDSLTREASSIDIAEDFEKQGAETVSTNESGREPRFEPIHAGDRRELTRLASQIAQSPTYAASIKEKRSVHSLRRQDTLDGVSYGDDVIDPNSKNFDVYKWYSTAVHFGDIWS